jgi:adhesin HecA-like repeat protein
MATMKPQPWLALSVCLLLTACRSPQAARSTVVVDADQIVQLNSDSRVPDSLLSQAGMSFTEADRILNRGGTVNAQYALPPGEPIAIQVKRAVEILLNGEPVRTAAATVGEAVVEAGNELYAADLLHPPAHTPVAAGMLITYTPARTLGLAIDHGQWHLRTSMENTEAALAEAGLPLVGLDTSQPAGHEPLPADGLLRLERVSEALLLDQESIPFQSTYQESADLELGLEQVLQPGQRGVAVTRSRIRYVDGVEVSREVESQAMVRPPQDRVVARGSQIVEKTASLDGVAIQYWRMLPMYATVYSPCNSGTADGSCSSGTASGLPAGKGVVAVDPDLFSFLNGQRLYIPGYGFATIGDVGGGHIVERSLGISRFRWIDLGFDDDNIEDMTGWITVYFLAPAPASIPDILR